MRDNENVCFNKLGKSPNRKLKGIGMNQIKSPLRESEVLEVKRSSGRLTLPSPIAVELVIVRIGKTERSEKEREEGEEMRIGEGMRERYRVER